MKFDTHNSTPPSKSHTLHTARLALLHEGWEVTNQGQAHPIACFVVAAENTQCRRARSTNIRGGCSSDCPLLLLTNMAENAGSNDMAIFIIACLGFSVVQDGMNCFPQHYQVQLHGAKAMRALLQWGGVEAIEEIVKQRALAMLQRAATRFDSVDDHEIRTVAKEARDLLQPVANLGA